MMPAFSAAISSTVPPSSLVWSSEIGVMIATTPSATFVESCRPPTPTSSTITSTGVSAKIAKAMPVRTSKKDIATGCLSSTSWTYGMTSSYAVTNRSGSMGAPSTQIRSLIETRCGLVNRPVRRPRARSSASVIRAVDVLPLVPVIWMTGQARCGSPSRPTSSVIRSRARSTECSGRREMISRSTSRIRASMSIASAYVWR